MDLRALTDTELAELHTSLTAEMSRRDRLAAIPEQIRQQAQEYAEAGGNPSDLVGTLTVISDD